MQPIKSKPIVVLITDSLAHVDFFKLRTKDLYHLRLIHAKEFNIAEIDGLLADIVILDERSLGHKIFDLCKEFRKQEEFHKTPIFIITGKLKSTFLHDLFLAGASDILKIPLDETSFAEAILRLEKHSSEASPHFFIDLKKVHEIQKKIKEHTPLTLLLMEIDQIELVTPHLQQKMLDLIKKECASTDTLFVLTEGKFTLLLDNMPGDLGLKKAKKMQQLVKKNFNNPPLTLSIGLTSQKTPFYDNMQTMIRDGKNALLKALKIGNAIIEAECINI